jgi:hypothetical protein
MKRFVVGMIAATSLVSMAPAAMAQEVKTLTPQMRTETGTIEAIEAASRTVTLKKADGTYVTTVAGPEIKRFPELKIGDKVSARFYETVVVRLKQPGEADVNTATKAVTPTDTVLPGGTKAKQRTISATITAIDAALPSVTFSGPNGWKYTSRVSDKAALAKVKVGDKVDITWTEAVLVSVEPGK